MSAMRWLKVSIHSQHRLETTKIIFGFAINMLNLIAELFALIFLVCIFYYAMF